MKKIIYLFILISLSYAHQTLSQVVIQDGFENVTCDNVPPNYSPFFDGCVDGWISTHGSAGINQGNISPYEGVNYSYMYVDFEGFLCTSTPHRGEGIALQYNFQQGATYKITYAIRGHNNPPPFATFERNWVLTNGLPNNTGGSNGCDPGEVIPSTPANSQFLATPSYNNNSWTVNSQTFTTSADFSQLWFRARNHHSTSSAQVFSQMYLDDFTLEIIDLPCVQEPIIITADGVDITDTLTYTIPCDQDCLTINATNLENAVYNTTDLVLTDLNGLFCLPSGSDLQSFTAYIEGQDSCGDDYYQEIIVNIEQDCCIDEPYIEPFWEQCDSNNVCELENWPVHVLDDDGTPLLIIDGYSFLWNDGSTSDTLYGVVAMQGYWVEVTYPDGCVYTITYYEACCEDDIEVIFDECPKAEMLPLLERELQNYDEERSVVTRPDLERAIESYRELGRGDGDDCDPCIGGIVNITIVDLDGNPITNYDSITITNNDTGVTVPVGIPNFGVYVDTSYTVTVVVTDADGHECTYTYDFEYVCEGEPCSELMSPSNVQLNGSTLTWDPVPGAIGYIVESTNFWPVGCSCDNPVSILPIETTGTSVTLPMSPNRCFVIQVRAICSDGTSSAPSDWICVGGNGGHGGKSIKMASITPNPTSGQMTFNVETTYDTLVTIAVYDIYGNVIKSFNTEVSHEKGNSIFWDGSNLKTGIYFVKFKTNLETIHQRVIVH